ncbi:RNA-binding domain-containing protein [Coniochaeta sp. PMI_546]|nr:RNA-binding domain-containing protein [Coniochaeta sp. PMI_546]
MSFPGPPGVSGNSSHPSLPPRPPQPSKTSSGFKPAFSAAPTTYSNPPSSYPAATSSYGAPPSYGTAGPRQYGAPPSTSYSSYPSAPPSIGASYQQPLASYNTYQAAAQPSYPGQPQSYYGAASTGSYSTPPAIRNPFPAPAPAGAHTAHNGPDLDPDTAAQIAQWQSAYMPKDASAAAADATTANGARGGSRFGAYNSAGASAGPQATAAAGAAAAATSHPAETAEGAAAAAAAAAAEKKKTVIREGGGKKWTDDSLLEWDPSHLRLFVGNLAGETTDESLLKAFSRWPSVQKAKVVRDKRTTKSKGYGFVSFSDPDDFFQAAKEMNGKYIQSHPVVVHKAKTEIKPQVVKDKRQGKGKGNWKNKKSGGGGGGGAGGEGHHSGSGMGKTDGAAAGYETHLGPHGGGVTKPGQKTRGGLKILG